MVIKKYSEGTRNKLEKISARYVSITFGPFRDNIWLQGIARPRQRMFRGAQIDTSASLCVWEHVVSFYQSSS